MKAEFWDFDHGVFLRTGNLITEFEGTAMGILDTTP